MKILFYSLIFTLFCFVYVDQTYADCNSLPCFDMHLKHDEILDQNKVQKIIYNMIDNNYDDWEQYVLDPNQPLQRGGGGIRPASDYPQTFCVHFIGDGNLQRQVLLWIDDTTITTLEPAFHENCNYIYHPKKVIQLDDPVSNTFTGSYELEEALTTGPRNTTINENCKSGSNPDNEVCSPIIKDVRKIRSGILNDQIANQVYYNMNKENMDIDRYDIDFNLELIVFGLAIGMASFVVLFWKLKN